MLPRRRRYFFLFQDVSSVRRLLVVARERGGGWEGSVESGEGRERRKLLSDGVEVVPRITHDHAPPTIFQLFI